jgi:cell division protein FtsB
VCFLQATLRYKGENGIMRKKFSVLSKDIEDQKEEMRVLHAREKELEVRVTADSTAAAPQLCSYHAMGGALMILMIFK